MGEARRFTRIPYQSEVLMNANGQWFRGLSENLSLYGIYIKANEKFDVDAVVELTIYLPESGEAMNDDNYIDVNSIVVRQDPDGIGCEFRQVDVDAFLNLKNVISSRCENKTLVMDEFYSYLSRKELMAS
ncbi:pilZ domain protein [Geobacter sp. OR-1]|uniref:PilZ domain-containing protein n=1 Tax=Geobacter sp. OR-1 TaxID=1266765 RepID=UPI00054451AA|nr:PilZ domain-containing protein [Geobacter sp. OR-1]GAM08902.1 pilZ domain protein [Geobacter sp. OR-1]